MLGTEEMLQNKNLFTRLKLYQAVFESIREAVLIADHNNFIVYVNPAFTRITGYNEQDVLGKGYDIISSNKHSDSFHQCILRELKDKGMYSGEMWGYHKNSGLIRLHQTVSSIKDEKGNVSYYVAVYSEIIIESKSLAELNFLSLYDPLTKLANRSNLSLELRKSLNRALEMKKVNALFFVDVDHFTHINESLGHNAGDQLLKDIAQRLKEVAKLSTIMARIGGDEFAIICECISTEISAVVVAQTIIEACKAPFFLEGQRVFVSVSIGICLYPLAGKSVESIMRNADSALRRAKESGRDIFAFYSRDMTEKANQRIHVASELRLALERDELELHYQPIYMLSELKLVGSEALVRWNHPTQGRVAPNDFIPIAEECGLISAIDMWVLRKACEQMSQWIIDGHDLSFMAVNLSSLSLSRKSLAQDVVTLLQQSKLDSRFLELEITESAIMENQQQADVILCQLRQAGIRIAIDDFGAGYSSLARLKTLPANKLKIDQSFIKNLPGSTDEAAIVDTILALGSRMGLEVQAEGIETNEQMRFLRDCQCELGQGYLFGRPLLAEEFSKLIGNKSNI